MTSGEFLTRHPEFANAAPGVIDATLAAQELFVSDSWGARRDTVLALQTARALALSPFGRAARMVGKDGTTTYDATLASMVRAHGCLRSRIVG